MEGWHTTRMHEGTRQPPALQLFPADSQAWSSARKTTTGSGLLSCLRGRRGGDSISLGSLWPCTFPERLKLSANQNFMEAAGIEPACRARRLLLRVRRSQLLPHGLARTRRVRGGKERLDDCAGFRVDSPSGRVGIIGDLHRDAAGSAVELIVLTGLLGRKRVIAVDEVAQIVPRESRLVLRPRVSST